jgi:hypothetical protein
MRIIHSCVVFRQRVRAVLLHHQHQYYYYGRYYFIKLVRNVAFAAVVFGGAFVECFSFDSARFGANYCYA